MSHSNRNFALAYVFLVALPIAGLVGILRSGRHLTAPPSIDGAWAVHATPSKSAPAPCMKELAFDTDTRATISQSGRNFGINVGKAAGTGVITGTTLRASLGPVSPASAGSSCGSSDSVLLTATIDANSSPRTFSGALSVAGCGTCEPVQFHALKQLPAQTKGGQ